MQTAIQTDFVPVEDYLASEETSDVRHEYLGGMVYAMAGATRPHNAIAGNLYFHLRQHLKGGPCKIYMSDIRVNFKIREDEYYYYPDIVVTCEPRDTHERFVRFPKLIVEVSSPSTQRIDRREKFLAYTTMESLEEYVLVPQTDSGFTVFRRANGWRAEKISGDDADLTLGSLPVTWPRAVIYEGV